MKTINVNIKDATVESFNEDRQQWGKCSFYEAGLYVNVDGDFSNITDKDEIIEYLRDCYEEEIEIIFEKN